MNQYKCILLLLLIVVFVPLLVVSKKSETAKLNLLSLYEGEIDLSLAVESSARNVTKFAGQRWSLGMLKILTDYRVRATELKTATLKESEDQDIACAKDVPRLVEEAMTLYLESETPCAKAANAEIKEPRKKVRHSSKEVKKWRQGLMFMGRKCRDDHPDDYTSAVQCLSRQVDTERYDTVITRLIVALEEAQNELLSKAEKAVSQLEQCMEESFLAFSTALSEIVADVTVCGEGKVTTEASGKEYMTPAPAQWRSRFRFKCLEP